MVELELAKTFILVKVFQLQGMATCCNRSNRYCKYAITLISSNGFNNKYNISTNPLVYLLLASAGGITTTGGDFYVGGDLYVADDIVYDEAKARNWNITGIATVGTLLDVNGDTDFRVYRT